MAAPVRHSLSAGGVPREPVPTPDGAVLTEKLGSGSYATVYKGYRRSDKTVVAVKCIERCRLSANSAENLFTEIKVMKEIDHPNIVRLLDFEWNTVHVFLVMEYCEGGDLSSFIHSHQRLRESLARRFLRQLALALRFLRSKGIAHMDLKPQNLLLTSFPRPVLKIAEFGCPGNGYVLDFEGVYYFIVTCPDLDFGMAQHLNAGDHAQSFRGSPLYMAPEIMLGEEYDAKVDLWSVGVILYETLFGLAPYASETLEELQLKVAREEEVKIPCIPEVSDPCKRLLEELLQKDPAKRISFEDFFNNAYIDLEHMPAADSLTKARALVKQAVVKDSEGKIGSAINYYCQALDYFMPALEHEKNSQVRDDLKKMIEQYIDRAEFLKSILRSNRPSKISAHETASIKLLDQMEEHHPQLKTGLERARRAEKLEDEQQYRRALVLYKEAVEFLLPLHKVVTLPDEKKILASEIQVYLHRAEELNVLLEKNVPRLSLAHASRNTIGTMTGCPVQ